MGVPCPCIWCAVDLEKGCPLRLVRWRDPPRMWWAPYRRDIPDGSTSDRSQASLLGPRHAAILRQNPAFVVVKPAPRTTAQILPTTSPHSPAT